MDYNKRKFNRSNLTPEFEDDFISNMPENVITYILDRVPIRYAVRTSILSSKWRFKWTVLSQLAFDRDFFLYLEKKGISKDFEKIVNRILLQHKGDIKKFAISLYTKLAAESISDWVMFLSRNRIKHLVIRNFVSPLKLPTHLFSCVELKHLMLSNVSVSPMPRTFHGFPNLLSLVLIQVVFESCTYGQLLTRCPLLKILNLSSDTTDNIKVSEFAKLENLRELCLPLCELDNRAIITSFDVLQHMSLFSKLQELRLDFLKCKVLVKSKERFQTLLPCIKALELYNLDFSCANMVSLAYALIFASRNARTLYISMSFKEDEAEDADDVDDMDDDVDDVCVMADIDCRTMGQLQLLEVSVENVTGSENEILLLKYLLSSSPLLKEMEVSSLSSKVPSRLVILSKKLLKLHRTSPIAEIHLY